MARWWRPVIGLFWLALLAWATLRPGDMSSEEVARISDVCVLCGGRGTADAIVNILLFAPLGFVLRGTRLGTLAGALLAGLALSLSVELIQSQIPGRHSSLADVIWNTTGAGAGWLLYGAIRTRIETGSPRIAWVMGIVVAGWFLAAGILMTPVPPAPDSAVVWTPEIPSMSSYDGEVLAATLDGAPLDPGPAPRIRARLDDRWMLVTTFRVGAIHERPSPLLAIMDPDESSSILLAVQGRDLLLHRSRLAGRLRFDDPGMRVRGALQGAELNDTTVARVATNGETTCLSSSTSELCASGLHVAGTWGLLLSLGWARPWLRRMIDLGWLMVLFVPLGFWSGTVRETVAAGSIGILGALTATAFTRLMLGPWYDITACLVGLLCGVALRIASVRIRRASLPQEGSGTSMAASV